MANETLITDLVAQEAMQQLEQLDRAMEGTLQQFQNCARELAQGLKIPVEVTGDVDALRTLTNTVMREAQQATQQLTQQLQQQQQVVANTTNTISRQLQAQENLNKAQREAFTQDQQAQDLAKALLGTRQQNYELLARYTAEMKANKDAQKQVNEEEKRGLITQEQAIERRAQLMAAYDRTKVAAAELTKILAAENREANAVQGSYQQLSQKLERLKMAYKQMNDAQKASAGGKELEKEIQNLDARLKDLAADMGEHQRNVGNYAIAAQSMKSSLRELTEEIAMLTMQYREMSDEEQRSDVGMQLREKITQLTEEAAKYKDVISDVKESISGSASDTRMFDSLIESGQLMVATFGLVKNAAISLGFSEKGVEEALLGVQQAMQAVQALQVIQNTLQSQSNLMKGIAVVQTKALAAAEAIQAKAATKVTGATKLQTIAQKAYNAVARANPYVLLATGAGVLAGAIFGLSSILGSNAEEEQRNAEAKKAAAEADQYQREQEEKLTVAIEISTNALRARYEVEEKMAESIASSVGKQLSNYEMLQKKWEECGNDLQQQQEFLVRYKEELKATGFTINDVTTATKFFVDDKDKVVAYFDAVARAAAAAAAAAEIYKQKLLMLSGHGGTIENGGKFYSVPAGSAVRVGDPSKQKGNLTKDEMRMLFRLQEQGAKAEYLVLGPNSENDDKWEFMLTEKASKIIREKRRKEAQELWDATLKSLDAQYEQVKNYKIEADTDVDEALKNITAKPNGAPQPKGGSRNRSSRSKTNKETVKSEQELQSMILDLHTDALKARAKVSEEYTQEWIANQKEAVEKESENELADAELKYAKARKELEKAQGTMSEASYNEMSEVLKKSHDIMIKAITDERDEALKKIDQDIDKHNEEIAHKELETQLKKNEQEISAMNNQNAEYLETLRKRYAGELALAAGNEKEIERIKKDYSDDVARAQINHSIAVAQKSIEQYEAILKKEDLSAEDRKQIETELAEAKISLTKAVTDEVERNVEKQIEVEKEAAEKRKENFEKWQDGIQKVGEAMGNVGDLMGAMFDNQIEKIEELMDTEQQRYDKEVNHIEWLAERGAITTEEAEIRKRDAEVAHAKQQEALEKKKAAWEYKKAVAQKANQVAQIGISTALGIMQALAMFPPNIPLSVFVGAMGAIQLATALAQPIKAYAEGTKGHPHPGGLAVVGDANRAELVMYGKRAWITPDSPTLVDLPKGAEVMPDASKVDLVQMGSSLFMTLPKRKGGGGPIIVNDYEALEGRVANNTKAVTQTLNRFERNVTRQMRRQNFRNYINART